MGCRINKTWTRARKVEELARQGCCASARKRIEARVLSGKADARAFKVFRKHCGKRR